MCFYIGRLVSVYRLTRSKPFFNYHFALFAGQGISITQICCGIIDLFGILYLGTVPDYNPHLCKQYTSHSTRVTIIKERLLRSSKVLIPAQY